MHKAADEALARLCEMNAKGMAALLENKALLERVCELEIQNLRLEFELKRHRNRADAYLRSAQSQYQECNRMRDLVGGRVERGKVNASLLVRGLVEILRWMPPDDDGDDGARESIDDEEQETDEQVS